MHTHAYKNTPIYEVIFHSNLKKKNDFLISTECPIAEMPTNIKCVNALWWIGDNVSASPLDQIPNNQVVHAQRLCFKINNEHVWTENLHPISPNPTLTTTTLPMLRFISNIVLSYLHFCIGYYCNIILHINNVHCESVVFCTS